MQNQRPVPGCLPGVGPLQGEIQRPWDHIGIVKEVLSHDFVLTIEGNTSPGAGIQREGDGVTSNAGDESLDRSMRTLGYLLPCRRS